MKTLRGLFLLLTLLIVIVPLVMMAQDNSIELTEDDIPEVPPGAYETMQARYEIQTLVHLATPATEELIEYPVNRVTATFTMTPRPTMTPGTETTKIINGLWALKPGSSSFSSSGSCQAEYGDNDGPPNYGSGEEIPTLPICMSSDNQWLKIDSGGALPLVVPMTYSEQEMVRELLTTNGATSGSVNVTNRRQYVVISPSEIEFSYTIQEEGGCTRTSSLRYTLVEANELVCSGAVITPLPTAQPTLLSTPAATPLPGETAVPVTPEPPVKPGRYVLPLPPVDDVCNANTMPPSDIFELSYVSDMNAFINFGASSYTLYWDGRDYYSYSEGTTFDLSLITYEGGASLTWSKSAKPGDSRCFVDGQLMLEGAPTATPEPIEPTAEAYTDVAAIAGDSFSVTPLISEQMCADATVLPDLSTAVMTAQEDGNFLFTVGGTDYTLTNGDGIHGYQLFNDDGSLLSITMNGFYEGEGMGVYMVAGSDGSYCMAQLTFKPG